jgi:hypothetical protein
MARVRWRCVIFEAVGEDSKKEYPFEAVKIKGGY